MLKKVATFIRYFNKTSICILHVYYSSAIHVVNTFVLYITFFFLLLTHGKGEREQFGHENRMLAVSTTLIVI